MTEVRLGTPSGRWVLAASVLGSSVAALDATVVNVALPAIGRDLHAGVTGLQWTLDSYLVTLASLILVGGSLGDHLGRRRVFVLGLASFAAASLVSGAAPNLTLLIVGRAAQGVGGALLEEFVYDEAGQPLATTFVDYLMPTLAEMPPVEVLISEDAPSPLNPLGVKGAGEGGTTGCGAAIAAAIADALGWSVPITRLPVTPSILRDLLRRRTETERPPAAALGRRGA